MESKMKNVAIVREGNQIVLPSGMSYAEGRQWLRRQEKAEETEVSIHDVIEGYPLDCVVGMLRAMRSEYGYVDVHGTPGFFGPTPPTMVQVPLAGGGFETAPFGRIAIPKWEGGYLEADARGFSLSISGTVKKKFEKEVKALIQAVRKEVTDRSIYRGQAVMVDLAWIADESGFDPMKDSPKFMELKGASDLILNDTTLHDLESSVFTLVKQTEGCRKNSIPIKHGALFAGPFGTGKTLAAKAIAKLCVENGWTFIYLKSAKHLAYALRLATTYEPAVLFAEDIDQVVCGGRGEGVNQILNTLDGVDTKNSEIVTVLTTNNPDKIEPAFLRAGRIDSLIRFDAPDAKTALRFITHFGGKMLAAKSKFEESASQLSGLAPAYIAEAVQRAKRLAIYKHGPDIAGKITEVEMEAAAIMVRTHSNAVAPKEMSDVEKFAEASVKARRFVDSRA